MKHGFPSKMARQEQTETVTRLFVFVKNNSWCFDWIKYYEITSNDFCFAQRSKKSACIDENPKIAGDLSLYAGDRKKGSKILRLPPNARELTA